MNFMISFLFTTKNYLKNVNLYFQIILHFIQCGKDLLEYLLKSNMIGKIMTFIYDNDGEKSEFRIIANHKYTIEPVELQITERSILGIKSKCNNDLSKHDLEFMWKVLEQLLLKSSLSANSNNFLYKKEGLEFIVPKVEIKKFTQHMSYVRYTISLLASERSIKSIAKIYGYLCFDNQEATYTVLQYIQEVLNDKDIYYLDIIFHFIFYICKINDNPILQEKRV